MPAFRIGTSTATVRPTDRKSRMWREGIHVIASSGAHTSQAAGPPRHRGGLILKLYSHSLSIALLSLFFVSFWLHLAGSTRRLNDEALQHGQPIQTIVETLVDAQFWYESFQNWQGEFLSIAVLIVLGIYLRERGSPESKPVAASHAVTGH